MDELKTDIRDIKNNVAEIKITLAKQHVSLEEHMRRTAILEAQLEPLKEHVAMTGGAMKLLALLATVAAILETIAIFLK